MEIKPKILGEMTIDGEQWDVILTCYDNERVPAVIVVNEERGETYAHMTVNLEGYGLFPVDGWIFVHHDVIGTDFYNDFKSQFMDSKSTPVPIAYGYATSESIKLKDELILPFLKQLID